MLQLPLKSMVFDRIVAALGLFKEVSLSLTCPVHCHPSVILPFVAGLSVGIVLGSIATTYLLWTLWFARVFPSPSAPAAPPFPRGNRHPRLAAYLDE